MAEDGLVCIEFLCKNIKVCLIYWKTILVKPTLELTRLIPILAGDGLVCIEVLCKNIKVCLIYWKTIPVKPTLELRQLIPILAEDGLVCIEFLCKTSKYVSYNRMVDTNTGRVNFKKFNYPQEIPNNNMWQIFTFDLFYVSYMGGSTDWWLVLRYFVIFSFILSSPVNNLRLA